MNKLDERNEHFDQDLTLGSAVFGDLSLWPKEVRCLLASCRGADFNSALTGSGYPAEWSYSSSDDRDRITIDPFIRTEKPTHRLQATLALMEERYQTIVCPTTQQWLSTMQPNKPNYGAWLGLRRSSDGADDRLESKLYMEVDPGIEQVYWPSLVSQHCGAKELVMIGLTPGDGAASEIWELYFRSRGLMPTSFASLLQPLADGKTAIELAGCLKQALDKSYGRRLGDNRLPGGTAGFSYALSENETVTHLTLFVFSRSFFGRDRRARQRFAQLLESAGKSADRYLESTESCVTNRSPLTQHGMFALTINAQGAISYSIGYCPVGVQRYEQ